MNAITHPAPATADETKTSEFRVDLLSGTGAAIFAAAAPAMVASGWSVFPQETTGERRMPGRLHGRVIKWSEDHDLANRLPTADFLRDCVLQCAGLNVACVFGPASGHTFAVDIDVTEERMAEDIVGLAEEHLGPTPFMRVGRAPKLAMIYRHSPDDLVRSVSRRFPDAEGQPGEHGLEILGAGKPLTFHGRHHRTGNYFKWLKANPISDRPGEAPEVAAQQVEDFLAAVEARFPFAAASRFDTREWTAEANGRVRVARVERPEGEGPIVDGREEYLSSLVWRTTRANGALIQAAEGKDALHTLVTEIANAIAAEFGGNARCDGRWAPAALRREAGQRVARLAAKIQSGAVQPVAAARGTVDAVTGRELPTITLETGEIESVVDAAQAALVAAERGIYQRGGRIVAVGETPVLTAAGAEISSQRVYEVGDYALLEHLGSAARWEKYDGRKKEAVRTVPPMWVAKSMAERAGRLGLPVLSGVISAPTLRADGTVLATPGYDAATGLLLDTRGTAFPSIPEAPTKKEAAEALALLRGLVESFPFVAAEDRAVALAALLTAPIRRSLRTAPLFAFTAPVAGSGKSTLVDLAALLATGREAGVIAQGKTDEESEKRLGSLLLGGDAIIAIDNCEQPVGGDLLCQMLTQTTVRPRVLGRSEAPEVPTSAFVAATGNNLVLHGDMTRRGLLCRLNPQVERPELRTFEQDPVATVKKERGRYVVAALTVLRAFHVAGRPQQVAPLGSFGEWSRWVRDALLWLGEADPVKTMEAARELDPRLDALTAVLSQWTAVLGGDRVTVRDIIAAAAEGTMGRDGRTEFVHADFREALLTVAGDGGHVNSRRLGKWLAAHAGRIAGGVQIARAGVQEGTATWRLEGDAVQAPAPVAKPTPAELGARLEREAETAFGDREAALRWVRASHPRLHTSPAEYVQAGGGLDYAVSLITAPAATHH